VFHLYIIQNPNGKLYIGQTNNLEDRLLRHNSNQNKYTKNKGPWKLIYSQKFETRSEAVKLELKFKFWKNKKRVLAWIEKQSKS